MTSQSWSAEGYSENARFVATYGEALFNLLPEPAGKRLLDLGCGDGVLTKQLVEKGFDVLGVDASAELLKAATDKGLTCLQKDAHDLDFEDEFDCVFSNAAMHWMLKPEEVLKGVHKALKPNGSFVAEFGGHGNVAALVTGILAALEMDGIDGRTKNPWFFPSVSQYQAMLEKHGFSVEMIALIPRPTTLPTGLQGWLATFANPFLSGLDEAQQHDILAKVEELVRPSLCDSNGNWTADYVRLRFRAFKAD